MAWNLKGQMIESCSCNMFCPCWFGVQELMIMDQGWCASVIGFRIREGRSDGVALDGRKVVFTPDFPGPTLFDGNATARVFVDEGADEAQQRELEAIFQGRKGGPMENLAPWSRPGCPPRRRASASRRKARRSRSRWRAPGRCARSSCGTRRGTHSRCGAVGS